MVRVIKHISAWVLLLLVLNNSDWTWQGFSTESDTFLIPSIYGTLFNALIFYGNVFYFYPRYWRSKKKKYTLLILVFIIAISLVEGLSDLQYSIYSGAFDQFKNSFDIGNAPQEVYVWSSYASFSLVCLIVHALFLALSFGYLMPKENLRNIALQNAQLKSELKYLKAQIDPHTLFNGINGIYHLIDEDTELAKQYLHGFANILRYQIYDCKEDLIPVGKEIQFLDRFMQLSNLRVSDDAIIKWDYPNYLGPLRIAPQIFLPFVENAFKHISAFDDSNANRICSSIYIDNQEIRFKIKNTFEIDENERKHQGLGISNSMNRLKLLYPKEHQIKVKQEKGYFIVDLTIQLNE
ncbi:MAG: histidine kinase [Ekhidna sp.]